MDHSLSPKAAKQRINKLRQEIEYHEKKYYTDHDPQISDYEFDLLVKELQAIEQKYPEFITPESPTQRVGEQPTAGFLSIEHRIPMLSLDNCYHPEELYEFEERIKRILPGQELEYVVELKIDGLGISVIYRKGKFFQAITRGDGLRGDDVTANVKTIRSLPLTIENQNEIEVRGEIYMPFQAFEVINRDRERSDEPLFANPRNAAAGSIRLLDPKEVAKRKLDAFLYSITINGRETDSQWENLRTLKSLRFKTNPFNRHCKNLEKVISVYEELLPLRETLDYDVDGIVVKVNSIEQQQLLGRTAKFPRWAISLKFPARQATTQVKDIIIQVGRTGALTPVALLEPVKLSGITISRATLHNQDEIQRKDIRIGDTVLIERSGDVIPKIISVMKEKRSGQEKRFGFPDRCPECGTEVFKPDSDVVSRCINPSCPAIVKESLLHYSSRRAMNIEGLGDALVTQLIDAELVSEIPDLYRLQTHQLEELERMGQKSAKNLIDEINKSKQQDLARLIYALGIRYVGERTAQILASQYRHIDALAVAPLDELTQIQDVGPKVGESVVFFFRQPKNQDLIKKLKDAGLNLSASIVGVGDDLPLRDQTFVFTGTLTQFTRDEARATIEKKGGRVISSLSSKTDYLIVGSDPGSKLQKAQSLGTTILYEEDFLKLLSN